MSVTGRGCLAELARTKHGEGSPSLVGLTHGRDRFEADPCHCFTGPGPIRYTNSF
jgi:hypothetical protein